MVAKKKPIVASKAAIVPTTKKSVAEKPRLRVNDEWNRLFIENETRPKPLTNDQLVAAMVKLFPDKATKTTILRVSMVRSIYNKGSGMFRKFGPAGGKARPISHSYDSKGNKIEGRPSVEIKKSVKPIKKAKPAKDTTAYVAPDEEVIEEG